MQTYLDQRLGSPDITSLIRTNLHLENQLSPGALHGSRIALRAFQSDNDTNYNAFIATGRHVYSVTAPRSTATTQTAKGKEGVHVAETISGATSSIITPILHRAEIQDLALVQPGSDGSSVLAAVDCYGRATIARLPSPVTNTDDGGEHSTDDYTIIEAVAEVLPIQPNNVMVEAGWAGISLAPDQPNQAAIARHFAKDVTIFDGPMAIRSIATLYRPNAVSLVSSSLTSGMQGGSPLVAVAEGPQVSLWDIRAAGRGGRVAKLSPGGPHSGNLYAVAVSEDGLPPVVGAVGADRSVVVWDPRKWGVLGRWNNCLKYEATMLHFSSKDVGMCFACGLDYEVICGRWDGEKRSRFGGGHRTGGKTKEAIISGDGVTANGTTTTSDNSDVSSVSFRGDSRWMGVAKMAKRDVVAAWTASGQLYVAEFTN